MKETITIAMAIGNRDHKGNYNNNDGTRRPVAEQISNQKKPLNN